MGEVMSVSSEYWKNAWAVLNGAKPESIEEASSGASHVVMKVSPQELAEPAAASNSVITHAPMGDYDVVEVAIFDQPAARIRWVADPDEGAGMIGAVKALPGNHFRTGNTSDAAESADNTDGADGGESADDAEAARQQMQPVVQQLRFAAADEAWNAGADEVYTVVKTSEKEALAEAGWEEVAEVSIS
ncbi:hypothetical protein HMPREF2128_05235 [Pseudoglutamicibacter albus DNF00011]|uniref:Uncharacterized protein n=1 Tax=Pseudoglutamicibacter albus DNF00011 TaxID=1401063 RepID=A0A095ZPI8_9MICC|nr:hypothetical protein HMPREF2128_05235 [Pseudoglutamicibacter albus DNF00011]